MIVTKTYIRETPCNICGRFTYYESNKRCVFCHKQKDHLRYKLNFENILKQQKEYYQNHNEKLKKYAKNYRKTPKGILVNRLGQRRWYYGVTKKHRNNYDHASF